MRNRLQSTLSEAQCPVTLSIHIFLHIKKTVCTHGFFIAITSDEQYFLNEKAVLVGKPFLMEWSFYLNYFIRFVLYKKYK